MLRICCRMTCICFHPASLRTSESKVCPVYLVRPYFCLTSPVLALSFAHPSGIRFLDFLIAQLCRSFGFASTRFELRSPGFTRTWSLFTDIGVFSCQLFYRDAIFFSSPQLAKKRRQIRFLDFLIAQLCRSFGFASTRFELRSPGFTRTEIRYFFLALLAPYLERA